MSEEEAGRFRLTGDRPGEDPAKDALGYAPIAEAIASSIKARIGAPDGFVYGVHGSWGSGKTTVLNYIVHGLRPEIADEQIRLVRFNPWWFSGQEDLIRAFFDELLAVIGEPLGEKGKSAMRRFAGAVSATGGIVKFGAGLVPGLNALPAEARNAVIDSIMGAGDRARSERSVNEQRQIAEEALLQATFRTLVIIDDIDRLTSDEQLQIFRLVKSVADLPKIDYILGFDDDLAARALADRPEYRADTAYLEKIVQAPFHLPVVEDFILLSWFDELFGAILGDDAARGNLEHAHRVFRSILAPTLTTPRAVIRLADALRARWPRVAGEVEPADLAGIEAIRLFERDVYNAIRTHWEWLTEAPGMFGGEDKDKAAEILTSLSRRENNGERKERMAGLLSALFPRFARAAGGIHAHVRNEELETREYRICSYAHFPTYFGLAPGHLAVSRVALEAVFAGPFDPDRGRDFFAQAAKEPLRTGGTRATAVVDALESFTASPDKAMKQAVLHALLRDGDILLTAADVRTHAGSLRDPEDGIVRLVRLHLSEKKADDRARLLLSAFKTTTSPAVCACVLRTIQGEHGRKGARWESDFPEKMIAVEQIAELERALHRRILSLFDEATIDDHPLSLRILVIWSAIGPEHCVTRTLAALAKCPEGRIRLAKLLLSPRAWDSTRGAYDTVPLDQPDLIDIHALAAAIKDDIAAATDPDPALARFIAAYDNAVSDEQKYRLAERG